MTKQTKIIKAWAIVMKGIFPNDKEFELGGTLNSLVKNYAIFENKKIAIKTMKFAKEINPKSKYKIIKVKIIL